jgi:hypothetical protein
MAANLSFALPAELREMIDERVCKRRSNARTDNNIVIFADVEEGVNVASVESEVVRWVQQSLEENDAKFMHLTTQGRMCPLWPWHLTSNTQTEEQHGRSRVVVAIHLGQQESQLNGFQWCADELTIVSECPPKITVSADDVLDSLKTAPDCITAVGVSAISDELMMTIWGAICERDLGWCMPGEGRRAHPCWVRFPYIWQEVSGLADCFGWRGWEALALQESDD